MADSHHPETEQAYPSTAYAWYVVVVLTLAYMVSFIDQPDPRAVDRPNQG